MCANFGDFFQKWTFKQLRRRTKSNKVSSFVKCHDDGTEKSMTWCMKDYLLKANRIYRSFDIQKWPIDASKFPLAGSLLRIHSYPFLSANLTHRPLITLYKAGPYTHLCNGGPHTPTPLALHITWMDPLYILACFYQKKTTARLIGILTGGLWHYWCQMSHVGLGSVVKRIGGI